MKSIFMLLLGIIIGYFLGAYSFFKLTVNFGADKISQIVIDSAQNAYSGTVLSGTNNISKTVNKTLTDKKQEVINEINQKQAQIKENLRQQLIQYMNTQINQLFGRI